VKNTENDFFNIKRSKIVKREKRQIVIPFLALQRRVNNITFLGKIRGEAAEKCLAISC